jgi:hypothetical protein
MPHREQDMFKYLSCRFFFTGLGAPEIRQVHTAKYLSFCYFFTGLSAPMPLLAHRGYCMLLLTLLCMCFYRAWCSETGPQSNELTRGTTELVQHFRWHKFDMDMVCLYRSPIPAGRGCFTRSNDFYLPPLCLEGGGVSTPCGQGTVNSLSSLLY